MAAIPQLINVNDLSPLNLLKTPIAPKSYNTNSITSILSISFHTLSLNPFIRFYINKCVTTMSNSAESPFFTTCFYLSPFSFYSFVIYI